MAEVTVEPGALRELHVGVSVLIASKSLCWDSHGVAPDTRRVALCPVIDTLPDYGSFVLNLSIQGRKCTHDTVRVYK
jgi:hypothetical protein